MKSNTYAAFLTMLLIVVYPLVTGIQADSSKDMTRFIPDGALVYFEQRHASAVLKEFTKSPLGKKFESINFLTTGEKIGLPGTTLLALKDVLSYYASIKNNKLFHEILGKRFAVAILSPVNMNEHADVKDYIKENAVVVAKVGHSAVGFELLGRSYGSYGQIYPVSSAQYGNHRIRRMKIKDQTFSLVIIEGFFVMSINEKQLRRCIDTFDHELPALAENDNFAEIRKSFVMPDRFFYLPVNDARKFVTERVADMTFTGKELLLKELATTVGFANFGYGSWNKKKSVIDKVLVQYESDEVNSVVKTHIDAIPSRCSMLSLTTENPMAFYWSNTIMINHFLRYIEKTREAEPQLEKFWSNVESITGKNTEEIFSLLGDEVSLVLEPGPEDKFFSFPLGIFFVRVKNVPELQTIFEKLIDEYDIQVSVRSYGPIHYSFWTPSPQDGLQPLYGFWDDLIFFGNSSRFLKMIVDRKSGDFSLLDNVDVKSLDPGFTKQNNSITYLNNVELIKVLQKWLGLVGMTLAIENRETAYKIHTVLEEIINPLLDGASMYERSCTRSYFTPEMVIIDSITYKATGLTKERIN
jgi:hypothetical protein